MNNQTRLGRRCAGIVRRLYRTWLRRQARRSSGAGFAGEAHLYGYGFTMRFVDRSLWLWQMTEIWGDDCYGVGLLPDAPVIVDAGANIGTFSLFVEWLRPFARIIAIEPGPENLEYLKWNLERNGIQTVEMHAAALGKESGKTRLAGPGSDSLRIGMAEGVEVETVPLRQIMPRQVDLLKLDIEGAELEVLKEGVSVLERVKRAAVEYHLYPGCPNRLPELLQVLRAGGFNRFSVNRCIELKSQKALAPIHCCHVKAWRCD